MSLVPVLFIPDTHKPFEHVRAYNLMLEAATYLQPKYIYLLGDYGDIYNLSGHGPKDPAVKTMLEDEILAMNFGLDQIDELFPDAKKHFIQGNHEWRLERFIRNKCPELFGLLSWHLLLNLNRRPKWSWTDWTPSQLVQVAGSKLYARHRPLRNIAQSMCSIVAGDNHRITEAHSTGIKGDQHVSFTVGWLGNKDLKAFDFVENHHNWQLGFGVAHIDESSGLFYHQKVHILESGKSLSCMINGKRFKT